MHGYAHGVDADHRPRTLLVSMMGPVDILADIDPEALVAATARLP